MAPRDVRRLPPVKTLYEMLPKGAEGGKEFARLVDLLLFHEGRRTGKKMGLFSDVAGDYHGLDSFSGDAFRKEGTTGYQYKFYPSPLSDTHRKAIIESLERTAKSQDQLKLKKWVLVTPENFIESSRRQDGGDVTWFENLRKTLNLKFELARWGHSEIVALFIETRIRNSLIFISIQVKPCSSSMAWMNCLALTSKKKSGIKFVRSLRVTRVTRPLSHLALSVTTTHSDLTKRNSLIIGSPSSNSRR